MLGASLALALIVLGPPSSTDPTELVRQLGSPVYARRESAGAELTRLGRAAIPALRSALAGKDAEVKARASTILARLERSTLVEPTLITLDFRDIPLSEAVAEINRRDGLALALATDQAPACSGRRLTLRSAQPLPFWKAIDALCDAGQIHYAPVGPPAIGQPEGSFPLYDEPRPSIELVSDSGPFRVQLSSVHYVSEIDLARPRPIAAGGSDRVASPEGSSRSRSNPSRQFYLEMEVAAEPRLSITQDGPVRLTSATDDRGQSLLMATPPRVFQHTAGYSGMNPSPGVRLRVDLDHPENSGRSIRLLKGVIPLLVAARKPDPLVVPLASAAGRSFRNHEVNLTVGEYRAGRNNQPPTLEITVRPLGTPVEPIDAGEGEPLAYRAESPQSQIEILDAQGRVITWFPSASFFAGEDTRLTLTLISRGAPVVPATLRYHGIIRAPSEVAFEFRDVPIP